MNKGIERRCEDVRVKVIQKFSFGVERRFAVNHPQIAPYERHGKPRPPRLPAAACCPAPWPHNGSRPPPGAAAHRPSDRKGENEIDIVAENELDDTATFFEVKRKAENIDMEKLETKAAAFMRATGEFKGYTLSYKGLSMNDM